MFRFACVTAMILVPVAVTYGDEPAIDLKGIDRTIQKGTGLQIDTSLCSACVRPSRGTPSLVRG